MLAPGVNRRQMLVACQDPAAGHELDPASIRRLDDAKASGLREPDRQGPGSLGRLPNREPLLESRRGAAIPRLEGLAVVLKCSLDENGLDGCDFRLLAAAVPSRPDAERPVS